MTARWTGESNALTATDRAPLGSSLPDLREDISRILEPGSGWIYLLTGVHELLRPRSPVEAGVQAAPGLARPGPGRLYEPLLAVLHRLAERHPLVLVVEDPG
jgi:hypothetical protein